MKKGNPSREDLLNGWLKYHNTTVEEVVANHPKEFLENPDWFKSYPVTQEQHDEWVEWAEEYLRKTTGLSKKLLQRSWGMVYLDCAPYVPQ